MQSTEQQNRTLIERFNEVGEAPPYFAHRHPGETYYPERSRMERELTNLLESRRGTNTELLAQYKSQFEWDTQYSVSVQWDMSSPYVVQEVECESEEEFLAYMENEKQIEEPDDWRDYAEENSYLMGEASRDPLIRVRNLRLKKKHRYHVALVVEGDMPDANALISTLSIGEQWQIVKASVA